MRKNYAISIYILLTLFAGQVAAKTLNKSTKESTVKSINQLLTDNYVYPEMAAKMNKHIQQQLNKGQYSKIKDANEFAGKLTEDLQSISKDKHLRILHQPDRVAAQREREALPDNNEVDPAYLRSAQQANFGFKQVKIIDGNIGYLNLTNFFDASLGGDTAVSAMNFLSNADALIIDLRENGGGSPSMIQLITSYLYGSERVHLNNFYWRPSDTHTQTWTLPHVQGKRRPDMPVYVLTSKGTFSAAEEFSYNLRNLERATLIGETTGGGAHPGGTQIVNDQFLIWLPQGRAINPITNTNWEGVGVKPHFDVKASDALNVAHQKAIESLAEANPGEEGFKYRWYLKALNVQNNPFYLDNKTQSSYAGSYGPRTISFENNELYYQRKGRAKHKMIALDSTTFAIEGNSDFRVQVVLKKGKSIALKGLYDSGSSDQNPRN